MFTLPQRLGQASDVTGSAAWQWACALRCAIPGIIVSFDADKQTCVVQPAIQELALQPPPATPQSGDPGFTQNVPTPSTIDPLQDVPVIMPRAGGWAMTFPIQPGDECLLVFGDMCIDGWWQSGGVQPQFDRRRHDLSDAFALFGPWSQPRRLSNYSTDSLQIRSEDGSVKIDLAAGKVTVTAPDVQVSSPAVSIDNGGDKQPVVLKPFLDWINDVLLPQLAAPPHNIVISPAPPPTSTSSVVVAQ